MPFDCDCVCVCLCLSVCLCLCKRDTSSLDSSTPVSAPLATQIPPSWLRPSVESLKYVERVKHSCAKPVMPASWISKIPMVTNRWRT